MINKIILAILAVVAIVLLLNQTLTAILHEQEHSPRPTRGELVDYCKHGNQQACDKLNNNE